jgi:hypothetical protein
MKSKGRKEKRSRSLSMDRLKIERQLAVAKKKAIAAAKVGKRLLKKATAKFKAAEKKLKHAQKVCEALDAKIARIEIARIRHKWFELPAIPVNQLQHERDRLAAAEEIRYPKFFITRDMAGFCVHELVPTPEVQFGETSKMLGCFITREDAELFLASKEAHGGGR